MKKKQDLRVIKTKKSLYEAITNLLKTKTFEEIKISDICEEALVNRSTFYAHYNDKYELFDSLLKDLKTAFALELENNKNITTSKEYYLEMLRIFLNHVNNKKEIYYSIINHNRNSVIIDMLYDTLDEDVKKRIEKENKKTYNNIPNQIITTFYLGAVLNIGKEIIKNKNKYTEEEIIDFLNELIPENL